MTRGAVSIGESDLPGAPAQAAIWGLGRVFGLDNPGLWGGLIDLPATLHPAATADGATAPDVARTVDEESVRRAVTLLGSGDADEFAVRESGVLARRMTRAPLDSGTPAVRTWQPSGAVLVTGGTGALGAHVARWLARSGAEHLVLTSRRGPDAPGAAALHEELSELGVRVTLAACDVTDRAAVAELISSVPAPLTAVVHTAGVIGEARPLADTSDDEVLAALQAKVVGALNLDALLADRPLDAFVLFSSGAGVWGNGGQGPYAAANAHLDALAERRRSQGRPATSIAWGAWAGGGMVDEAVAEQLRRRGVPAMAPDLAVQALRDAVERDETTLVVADIRWDRFLPAYSAGGHRPLLDELPDVRELLAADQFQAQDGASPAAEQGSELLRRLVPLPDAKRRRVLLDLVREHASKALGHRSAESVHPGRAFRELGFDSLTAVELRNRLNSATGLRLPATLVFDHPTAAVLAEYLRDALLPQQTTDEAAGADSAPQLAELQRLEAMLKTAPDQSARQIITDGLRTLLRTWAADEPEGAGVDDEIAEATDEDMFDLIDRELGIS